MQLSMWYVTESEESDTVIKMADKLFLVAAWVLLLDTSCFSAPTESPTTTWDQHQNTFLKNRTADEDPPQTSKGHCCGQDHVKTTTSSSLFRRRFTRPSRHISPAEAVFNHRLGLGLDIFIAVVMYVAFLIVVKNFKFS